VYKRGDETRIRFLNHDLNGHEVIENARVVVVIKNTVGFETIYHRKPLVTLGEPPYGETPSVTNVESLRELPKELSPTI
jgi:capsule polysaccharide export protein KpsC/LpsZ